MILYINVFPSLAYYNNKHKNSKIYHTFTNDIIYASFYTHNNNNGYNVNKQMYFLYIDSNKIKIGTIKENTNLVINQPSQTIVGTSSLIYCAASKNGTYLAACSIQPFTIRQIRNQLEGN